jgi:AraC-like DNA-binding protein/ActR/RegA family two-component response regulator
MEAIVIAIVDRTNPRPTMVQRFLQHRREGPFPIEGFGKCIEEVLHCSGVGHPPVRRAIGVMEHCFHEPTFRPGELADRMGTRTDVLARLFERVIGMSPSDYLRDLRIERAADLLATTSGSSKEVWVSVGYNHASNFCHDFKKKFGMSPLEFRARQIRAPEDALTKEAFLSETSLSVAPDHQAVVGRTGRGSISILVVDDDPGTRTNLCAYFGHRGGYTTRCAETGVEGIQMAIDEGPSLILLDYQLPDIDGLECVDRLRRQGIDAPVIVFSADCDVEELGVRLATQRAVFLSKLTDFEVIEEYVKSATDRAQTASRAVYQ